MNATETESILAGFADFLSREVDKLHADNAWLDDPRSVYDETGRYSAPAMELAAQVRSRSAAAGYYTMALPSALGGGDLGFVGMFHAFDFLFRHCGSKKWLGHFALAHWSKGPSPLLRHATESARSRILADLASGEKTMCFAMSEPDAGSDAWLLRTHARRVEGGWTVSGSKQWISNGANADFALVVAVTDPDLFAVRKGGVGVFLVDTSSDGYAVDGVTPMFGGIGSDEAVLRLDDVFVPDDQVLGDPGAGFAIAMEGVSHGRIYNCAKAVGTATWAFEKSLSYVKIRSTFGRPLSENQAISFGLADSAMAIQSARLVGLNVARLLDAGQPARKELAMAKIVATKAALDVIDRAVQSHGAMGFTNEVGLAKAWQMIRILGVADGTNEILRRQVAQELLRGDVSL